MKESIISTLLEFQDFDDVSKRAKVRTRSKRATIKTKSK